jgi:HlyD family secretion protein
VLLPGLTANAKIVLEAKRNVLKVPSAALRFRPKGTSFSSPAVWVLKPNGPTQKSVRVGLSDASFVEVEGDLEQGEKVIVGAEIPQAPTGLRRLFGRPN